MADKPNRTCFVIMPFRPEFHYFYLYLKKHIEEQHGVICKRGDADVLTIPLLDKIRQYISDADVLIADCSGRNANVFYELGMAHAVGKKVILITHDPIEKAPVDIRHYEFIRYELDNDREFLDVIDKALRMVFVDRYEDLFEKAKEVFAEFKQRIETQATMATKDEFIDSIVSAEQFGRLPSVDNESAMREFLLPTIVANKNEPKVIKDMGRWYEEEIGRTESA